MSHLSLVSPVPIFTSRTTRKASLSLNITKIYHIGIFSAFFVTVATCNTAPRFASACCNVRNNCVYTATSAPSPRTTRLSARFLAQQQFSLPTSPSTHLHSRPPCSSLPALSALRQAPSSRKGLLLLQMLQMQCFLFSRCCRASVSKR